MDDSSGSNNSSLVLPDVIVTKRNRSDSIIGRIEDDVERGTVKYFCRSRGHGFIVPENVSTRVFDPSLSCLEFEATCCMLYAASKFGKMFILYDLRHNRHLRDYEKLERGNM